MDAMPCAISYGTFKWKQFQNNENKYTLEQKDELASGLEAKSDNNCI